MITPLRSVQDDRTECTTHCSLLIEAEEPIFYFTLKRYRKKEMYELEYIISPESGDCVSLLDERA